MAFIIYFFFSEKVWKNWKNWNYLHKIIFTVYSICYTRVAALFIQKINNWSFYLVGKMPPLFTITCWQPLRTFEFDTNFCFWILAENSLILLVHSTMYTKVRQLIFLRGGRDTAHCSESRQKVQKESKIRCLGSLWDW